MEFERDDMCTVAVCGGIYLKWTGKISKRLINDGFISVHVDTTLHYHQATK